MLAALAAGLVSGVGMNAEESCAAIRCGINNFQETRFVGRDREWLVGGVVELEEPWRGTAKLAKLATRAISDCLSVTAEEPGRIPVLVAVAETERPGRIHAAHFLQEVERELGINLHPHSRVLEQGRVAGAVALLQARRMLQEGRAGHVIVAGVDSFLTAATLTAYDRDTRLLTKTNSNGFIPGEAAAAVLLAYATVGPLLLRGLGFAREPAPFASGRPLRAEGLVQAMRAALGDAGIALKDCDHRIADLNGEQYRFKEAALAVTRLLRDRKGMFSVWHLGDCIGEIGAATVPAMLAALIIGAREDYLPGPVVIGHVGNDDDKRAAFVVQAATSQTLALEAAAETVFSLQRRTAV
jgi:3-oxoacyl-[acyl-carrier-protein] synthase-1